MVEARFYCLKGTLRKINVSFCYLWSFSETSFERSACEWTKSSDSLAFGSAICKRFYL